MNWIRLKSAEIDLASDFASVVFPTPGTSSMRICPPAQERDHQVFNHLILAQNHFAKLGFELSEFSLKYVFHGAHIPVANNPLRGRRMAVMLRLALVEVKRGLL